MAQCPQCPRCSDPLTVVFSQRIDVSHEGNTLDAIAYTCPTCDVVLGVEKHPSSLRYEIIEGVVDEIRRMLARIARP